MGTIVGTAAVYDGISNSPWKYAGGGSSFEERDANLEDVVNFNLDQAAVGLGLVKMVRGRITANGVQTFQRASLDIPEINAMGIPSQNYVTMYFPMQGASFTGWVDSVEIQDHLQGDLVTISVCLYVFTGWVPRLTNSGQPIPPEPEA